MSNPAQYWPADENMITDRMVTRFPAGGVHSGADSAISSTDRGVQMQMELVWPRCASAGLLTHEVTHWMVCKNSVGKLRRPEAFDLVYLR
jgi:hypothetical protein